MDDLCSSSSCLFCSLIWRWGCLYFSRSTSGIEKDMFSVLVAVQNSQFHIWETSINKLGSRIIQGSCCQLGTWVLKRKWHPKLPIYRSERMLVLVFTRFNAQFQFSNNFLKTMSFSSIVKDIWTGTTVGIRVATSNVASRWLPGLTSSTLIFHFRRYFDISFGWINFVE